ncbi:hypothetical protein QZH41_001583 [Actinostola sp. cb2023]|nr:hypothetical protein QZH41_001583 [Actinostola sp. cb2023]
MNNRTIDEDETLVSYDVTSLFTEIPLDETINHILDQIYKHNKLPPLASKLVFKRLLEKVIKGTIFSFNGKLYMQTYGCSMGNPLQISLCVNSRQALLHHWIYPFYDRYVDDCLTKKKTNTPDLLLESLNNFHPNIQFIVEVDPDHFLDTSIHFKDGKFTTSVYKKPGKLFVNWKSATPIKWKRNTILGALHRAKRIVTNWEDEVE